MTLRPAARLALVVVLFCGACRTPVPNAERPAVAAFELPPGDGAQPDGEPDPYWTVKPRPVYPATAKAAGVEGSVVVTFQLHPSGRTYLVDVAHSSGHTELDQSAVDAVRQWIAAPDTHFHLGPGPFRVALHFR